MAEMAVRIEGGVVLDTTTPLDISIVGDNGASPNVAVPGPALGAGLVVTTGSIIDGVSLDAVSIVGAGAVVDFGSGKAHITMAVTASAGVSAGVVALEVSQDNVRWYPVTPAITLTAPGVTQSTQMGAWRYARANITTAITGGTIRASIMAA